MATIINNPDTGARDSGGMGLIVGVILAILIVALFVIYGLPAIRGTDRSGTNVNVPEKVDINVNNPSGGQ